MVLQLFILGIVIFLAPLVPPVLSPLGYSMTGALLLQKANPRTLSFITVGVSTFTAMIIWVLQNYIIDKLTFYEKINSTDFSSRFAKRLNTYFRNQKRIAKISLKRERYIETRTGKIATFGFAIFCFLPVIPDIISTRILYKKIPFIGFIIAVFIGKSITHVPFIFLGKSLLQILHVY